MRQRHADRHALAMHEAGAVVAGRRLQRMAERVAEIEQRAVAGLEFVARDDIGLGAAAIRRSPRCAPDRRQTPACQFFSSQAKKSGRSISPYLATSA